MTLFFFFSISVIHDLKCVHGIADYIRQAHAHSWREGQFCFLTSHCVSAASEPQTGLGEETISGQLGELQETVRSTQVEGKMQPWYQLGLLLKGRLHKK